MFGCLHTESLIWVRGLGAQMRQSLAPLRGAPCLQELPAWNLAQRRGGFDLKTGGLGPTSSLGQGEVTLYCQLEGGM